MQRPERTSGFLCLPPLHLLSPPHEKGCLRALPIGTWSFRSQLRVLPKLWPRATTCQTGLSSGPAALFYHGGLEAPTNSQHPSLS